MLIVVVREYDSLLDYISSQYHITKDRSTSIHISIQEIEPVEEICTKIVAS